MPYQALAWARLDRRLQRRDLAGTASALRAAAWADADAFGTLIKSLET